MIALITVGILLYAVINYLHFKHNLEEYNKYCLENCELTKVSNEELDIVLKNRYSKAIENIEEDKKTINAITKYLNEHKLNDKEKEILTTQKITKNYDSKKKYNIDELINIETDYAEITKSLENLKKSYQIRYLTSQILKNKKNIDEVIKKLESENLTKEEIKVKNLLDKKLTFDEKKSYTVSELSDMNQTYNDIKKGYCSLLNDVNARKSVKVLSNSQKDFSNNNYSIKSKGSSSKKKTSNNSDGNVSGGRVCPYSSESEANNYGYSHMDEFGGFGVYPCAGGTWEIGWFEK